MSRRLVAAALGAAAVGVAVGPTADAATGGRIQLHEPTRIIDTSNGIGLPSPGNVTELELGTGVLHVGQVFGPPGTVFQCSDGPTAGEHIPPTGTIFYSSDPLCFQSPEPTRVIVDKYGDVTATPTSGGLQYSALADAEVLTTQMTIADEVVRIERPAELSAAAAGAVLAIEINPLLGGGFVGSVVAYGCDGDRPLGANLTSNFANAGRFTGTSVPIALDPQEDICLFTFGGPVPIRVELLGELTAAGGDDMALPPSYVRLIGDVPAPSLAPINPVRVLNTRTLEGLREVVPDANEVRKIRADEVITLEPIQSGFPPGAVAISMNVTVVAPETGGFLSVWDCQGPRPMISNLNFKAGQNVANLVVAELGPAEDGTPFSRVCLSPNADAHVLVDVTGVFIPDGGYSAVVVDPTRVLDTREGLGGPPGKLGAGETLKLQVTGPLVPQEATAVTMNVTAVNPDDNGFLTIFPCDQPQPDASSLNYVTGENRANLVLTQLAADGTVCIFSSAPAHILGDVAVWFGQDQPNGLIATSPERILDTRFGTGVDAPGKRSSSDVITLDVRAAAGVTAESDAVVMNLTIAAPEGKGFATAWPCDQAKPLVSNLNFEPSENVPNLVTVKVSDAGTVCIQTSQTAHVLADVTGSLSEQTVEGSVVIRR